MPLPNPHRLLAFTVRWAVLLLVLLVGRSLPADGPGDNRPEDVRPIPPLGIEVDATRLDQLAGRCDEVRDRWQGLVSAEQDPDRVAELRSLEPEVLVFPRAVELAIEFRQFYRPAEVDQAARLLEEAGRRIAAAEQGGDWAAVVGLRAGTGRQFLIGGYRSRIDGSHQPYALVLPVGLGPADARPRRLDIWFHGRGEKLSEVAFLAKQGGLTGRVPLGNSYAPDDTIVLHPYGRYSNAFKFAGEVDVLEALEHVRERLAVDPTRISVRGFSMGGAACWQFATHYADRWFAANPGAGFSETPEFLSFFQQEDVRESAPDFQQTLWQLYDCPTWALNLVHCPTIAYSGEIDRQKQAADVMEAALDRIDIDLVHVIGPQTAHKVHPQSKVEIESRMASLARNAVPAAPRRIEFTTVTLRYHRMHWVDVRGLAQHWKPATVGASVDDRGHVRVGTENVTALRLDFGPGQWPGRKRRSVTVHVDGVELNGPSPRSDHSWSMQLIKTEEGNWVEKTRPREGLRKRPGLQGPIDDAFMDSFLFVLPSGTCRDADVERWVKSESAHAMEHWRKHFRGDVRQVTDTQLSDDQIASSNLVLFGDPESNKTLARIVDELPIDWSAEAIRLGDHEVAAAGRVPILVYPNPLNPDRYVVLNSGFTFREYAYLNNARQTPKLPDWALVDIREGATSQLPGKIEAAGFFDESWQP